MSSVNTTSRTNTAPVPTWEQLRVLLPSLTAGQLAMLANVPVPQKFAEAMGPELDDPYNFDPGVFNIGLQQLDGYQTEQSFNSAEKQNTMIDHERASITAANKVRKEEIKKNEEKAKGIAGDQKAAGWAGTIFGCLGAILPLLACTGVGMAVVAGIGLFMGALQLTSQILAETDVKVDNPLGGKQALAIDIPSLIGMAVDKVAADNYTVASSTDGKGRYYDDKGQLMKAVKGKPFLLASDEQNWKTGLTVGFSIAIALAMGYGGAKGMGALTKMAKGGEDALSKVKATALAWQRVAQAGAVVSDAAGAGTAVFDGVKGVENAELESETDSARAEQTLWQGMFDNDGEVRSEIMAFMRNRITTYTQNETAVANTTRTFGQSNVGFMPNA